LQSPFLISITIRNCGGFGCNHQEASVRAMSSSHPYVLLLGPARTAISGVPTHLNQLFQSQQSTCFRFQVGSEGRTDNRLGTLLRVVGSPLALAMCVVRRNPRIVHINPSFDTKGYWRDPTYLAVAKVFRRRIAYQVRGGALPQELFFGNRWLTSLLRRVLSYPDFVVLLSERELIEYRAFARDVRLVMIANAVEIEDVDLKLERNAPDRPLEVVYTGRLTNSKRVFDSVEAIGILRSRGIEGHLKHAGSGPADQQLRKAIMNARLDDRVELRGPIFAAAKQQLWRNANVLAFPSYGERLPYALLESMAASAVPVISPVGAMPQVMQDQVHGIFVPPRDPQALADVLERLHRNRASLRRMVLAGRQRIVDQYSVGRLAAQFQRLYTSLV
jgi:glycosyltransferase involved in cell wall biosynthesis